MARIVLVGEAWGAREALFEHAFVGSSGQELVRMMHAAGLAPPLPLKYPSELEMLKYWREVRQAPWEIEIVNVFNIRPADNKVDLFFCSAREGGLTELGPHNRGKYLRPEFRHHITDLHRALFDAKPNLILALGNTACWAILGEVKISAIRGTIKFSDRFNCKVLPTFHPASVLREWPQRPIVINDFEKAAREADTRTVTRIERWLTIEPTLAEIEEWADRPASYYAVDIENPKKQLSKGKFAYLHGQIAMIGFARSPHDAIVVPFFDPDKPGGNYWPTAREEVKAWKLADRLLSAPVPKVFQNGVFDLTHLLRTGFRPTMCDHDTMLLHHARYPEMRKGLGFLGSVYSDEIAWKQMAKSGNNLKRDE